MKILKGKEYRCIEIPNCNKGAFKIGNTYTCIEDNKLCDMSVVGAQDFTSCFELSKESEITLRVGDTFKNSNNALIEIQGADAYKVRCYSKSWGNPHTYDVSMIKKHINTGLYTDYKSISQQSIKTSVTTKQWKREDFLNTKIRVDTPEKSKRFQELLRSLKITWGADCNKNIISFTERKFMYVNNNYILSSNNNKDEYEISFSHYKEIFYDEIFNENNNQQLNQNQNGNKESSSNRNDVSSTDLSRIGGTQTATACAYRKTSRIASSSGYTGNRIQGKSTPTKIGRSQISFTAISI